MNKNIIIGAVLSKELWEQLTKDGSIENAINRLNGTGNIPANPIPSAPASGTSMRWSESLEQMCDMTSKDGAGTPEFIEDPETGDIVSNPEYNSFA